jgi:hypothetical protein
VRDFPVIELTVDLLDDLGRSVADLADTFHRVAEDAQTLRNPVRVCVEGESADKLVANGDDAGCVHSATI